MKKVFLASLAIICLGLGLSIAQNITRSIQLSQDPTGPFGVDSLGGVFFSNHINTSQVASPVLVGCGTSPTLTGTDTAGEVVEGTGSVTACSFQFARAYTATPYCYGSSSSTTTPVAFISSPSGFNVSHIASAAVMRFYYNCTGGRIG